MVTKHTDAEFFVGESIEMSNWVAMAILADAHRAGLAKLAALEQAADDVAAAKVLQSLAIFRDALDFFDGDLQQHFRHEEQALFPAMAQRIGRSGPIGAMLGEHESLWQNVDDFSEVVEEIEALNGQAGRARLADMVRLARHIVFLLRGHIKREDEMLFPLAEKTLDAQAKREVDENIRMLDRMRLEGEGK